MSGFLVTYGPSPRIWCTGCEDSAPLVPHIDGRLRPQDIKQLRRSHVCGPGPWDLEDDQSRAALAEAEL